MTSELIVKTKKETNDGEGPPHEHQVVLSVPHSSDSTPEAADAHMLEILRKNMDLVKLLSELECEECSGGSSGKNGTIRGDSAHSFHVSSVKDGSASDVRRRTTITLQPAHAAPDFGLTDAASLLDRLRARLALFYVEVLDDLSQTNDDLEDENAPPKNLKVQALHRDVKRCMSEGHPYMEMAAGLHNLFVWKSPLMSLMMFCMYSYCVYTGWLFSAIMFILLLQLTLNYLRTQKNIDFGLNFLPKGYVPKPSFDLSGAHLVFDVAKYSQMFLEMAADIMEKVKHLLLWTRPRVTATFYAMILLGFLSSLVTPMRTIFTMLGLLLGGKAFLTTYLFHRFPRLRHKFDVAVLFLDRLPTDSELREEYKREDALLEESASNRSLTGAVIEEKIELNGKPEQISTTSNDEYEIIAHDVVASPKVDDDIQRTARSCILIDKEKSFPHSVGRGSLVLTYTSLIFTYHRLHKGKQEICQLDFDKITLIKKAHSIKHFHLLPSGGHAIDVYVQNREKPYHFIGLANRDALYEELVKSAEAAGFPIHIDEKHD